MLTWLKDNGALGDRPVDQLVFHEVTRNAVLVAMVRPRAIDMDLVRAQHARRAFDYLVGFHLSPVLWRKVRGGRSVGCGSHDTPSSDPGCLFGPLVAWRPRRRHANRARATLASPTVIQGEHAMTKRVPSGMVTAPGGEGYKGVRGFAVEIVPPGKPKMGPE